MSRTSPAVRAVGTAFYVVGLVGLLSAMALLWVGAEIRYTPPPDLAVMAELESAVEVLWDSSGTFHLLGETWEDVLAAQGWLHARDRFFQMEAARLVGQGRVSELIGARGIPIDRAFRTLGLEHAAQREVEALTPDMRQRLASYAEGVNAWLESRWYRPPPEFVLLRWTPQPWSLEDSALILKLTAFTLSNSWMRKAVRAALEARFEPGQVALLLPDLPEDVPVDLVDDEAAHSTALSSGSDFWLALARTASLMEEGGGAVPAISGSNAWVVDGSRSASGYPLLANDPHIVVQMPSALVANGLHLVGQRLVGVTLPGVPGVVMGRSGNFAWALTSGKADDQDLYVERPVEEDGGRYWYGDRTLPFTTHPETLHVRGGDPITFDVRISHHGPIISDVLTSLLHLEDVARSDSESDEPEPLPATAASWVVGHPVVALRWSGMEEGGDLKALAGLLAAETLEEAEIALRELASGSRNVLLADTAGTIAQRFTGRIPIRDGWDGSHPVPGWTATYEWSGFIPFEELPHSRNPGDGILITTNDRPPGTGTALGRWWMPPNRTHRIRQLLEEEPIHTLESFARIQMDVLSLGAREIVTGLLALPPSGPGGERARSVLQGWDGAIEMSGPAALYELFIVHFFRELLLDELGEDGLRDYLTLLEGVTGRYQVVMQLLDSPGASWWDDVRTRESEDRATLLERAWDMAFREAEDRFGPDPADWLWGSLHTVEFIHPVGRLGPLSSLLNRGPFALPGDSDTVLKGHFPLSDPFDAIRIPAWRHLVDLGPPLSAMEILPPGNSAHFLSPHYDDQITDWLEGLLRPSATGWDQVLEAAHRRMRLVPPDEDR
jgi:penicillin amidase